MILRLGSAQQTLSNGICLFAGLTLLLLARLLLAHLLAQLLLDDDWVQGALGLVLIYSLAVPVLVSTSFVFALDNSMIELIVYVCKNGLNFNYWSDFQLFGLNFNLLFARTSGSCELASASRLVNMLVQLLARLLKWLLGQLLAL